MSQPCTGGTPQQIGSLLVLSGLKCIEQTGGVMHITRPPPFCGQCQVIKYIILQVRGCPLSSGAREQHAERLVMSQVLYIIFQSNRPNITDKL